MSEKHPAASRAPLTEVFRGEILSWSIFGFFVFAFEAALTCTSIVAVHGLNGDAFKTWTTNKTNKFWLGDADLLPAHLKRTRILMFSYNASVTALFEKTSSDQILQHAHTLVAELVAVREVRFPTLPDHYGEMLKPRAKA